MKTPIYEYRWFAPIVLLVLTLIFFSRVILMAAGEGLKGNDFQQLHYPLLEFVVRTVQDTGTIPLWNPHQFLGYSVVGNPQYGLFYPPNWLLLFFEGEAIYRGVGLLVALHIFWLALGTTYLMRSCGAHPVAALGAGIMVAFGGFPAARIYAGHYAVLLAMAWMPFVMTGLRQALVKKNMASAIPGGLALAMDILAGHPQMIYILGIGLGIQFIYEIFAAYQEKGHFRSTPLYLRQFLLIIALGGMLSAISWLPAWDYREKTQRGAEADSLEFANQHAVPTEQLFGLIVPDWFGVPTDDPMYWGEPFYEEMTAYVGILPLLCLLLIPKIRRREIYFFVTLALVGVILSVGEDGLLYRVLYEILPPARDFRAPGRFLLLTSIGFAGVMAITLTELCQSQLIDRRRLLKILTRYTLPLIIVGFWLWGMFLALEGHANKLADERAEYRAIQLAATIAILIMVWGSLWAWAQNWKRASALGLALLVMVGTFDVWRVGLPIIQTDKLGVSPIWQAAERHIPQGAAGNYGRVIQMSPPAGIINGASWTGHLSPQGYDPIVPLEWAQLSDRTGQYLLDPGSATNRIYGVRYVLSATELQNYGFGSTAYFENIGQEGEFWFYENPGALPRAYLVQRYEIESNHAAIRERIMNGEVDRGDVVLLDEDPDCRISGQGGEATITEHGPNEISVRVVSEGAGLLILTDQYEHDWRVEIDGEKAGILRANGLTRGVCVPAGEHSVRFFYRPQSLYIGGWLSLGGVILSFALLGGKRLRKRRPDKVSESL